MSLVLGPALQNRGHVPYFSPVVGTVGGGEETWRTQAKDTAERWQSRASNLGLTGTVACTVSLPVPWHDPAVCGSELTRCDAVLWLGPKIYCPKTCVPAAAPPSVSSTWLQEASRPQFLYLYERSVTTSLISRMCILNKIKQNSIG